MINKYNEINYYESEYYKIQLYNNKYKDKFFLHLNSENKEIYIKRIDTIDDIGWGQDLNLIIRNKIEHTNEIINVGSSKNNIKKIYFNSKNFNEYNHYENDNYKIFYISEKYNDVFKISYDETNYLLKVKRLDDEKSGWGNDLLLKYVDKNTFKEKIIKFGSSKINETQQNIDINILPYRLIYNYYESKYYTITLDQYNYSDLFIINFYEENQTIYIKRMDSDEGWGGKLKINIFDIEKKYSFNIFIGKSTNNEIYKKLNLTIRKYFISLTTIPSRIKLPSFMENMEHLLLNQTYPIEMIYITIAKKYKRFTETIDQDIINKLKSFSKINLIILDEDYGPASKYLAPLINYYKELENNILIVIDDDRKYNVNLVKNFATVYNSFQNITFSSGLWKEYFNKDYKKMSENYLDVEIYKESNTNNFHFGNGLGGFMGFAIKVNNLNNFIEYNLKILDRLPKSFYHDEGIILGYLKYKEETIIYLNHKGCNYIDDEMVDALCKINSINRGNIEKEILQITNLEKLL